MNVCIDGEVCEEDWGNFYTAYQIIFTTLFAIVALTAGVQLIRFIALDGFSFTLQKALHAIFFVFGVVRVVWLMVDPHNVKEAFPDYVLNLATFLIFGLGMYLIVFSYLLVLLMWSNHYKMAVSGTAGARYLKYSRSLFVFLMILDGAVEIRSIFGSLSLTLPFRRSYEENTDAYNAVVSVYDLFACCMLIFIISSYLFYGLRLRRNLAALTHIGSGADERLKRVTVMTMGVTIICCFTLVSIFVSWLLEITTFHFQDMFSFLVEQTIFRIEEASLSFLILYFLRALQPATASTSPPPSAATPNMKTPLLSGKT